MRIGRLDEVACAQRAGRPLGITSVCSAHPTVLQAAVQQAAVDGSCVLIEATSNQVDQTGGYTGMRPTDFRDAVRRIAAEARLPADRVLLGGDHLGPHRWRALDHKTAMDHADVLVDAYVRAGFDKIHLDCSYPCAGDPDPLPQHVVAERAARLLRVAEQAADATGAAGKVRYVIGTEVPVPGGADEEIDSLTPTDPGDARETLRVHRAAFDAIGVGAAWAQVVGLVVQPGVEFDHLRVVDYDPARTAALRTVLDDEPAMVFEAHSTDYQTVPRLTRLVADGWAILKVGPGLTFALREALFALAAIEDEVVPEADRSQLPAVVEARMLADPTAWAAYYPGDPDAQRLARRFSYSDRMRYYWPVPEIHAATGQLIANLRRYPVPLPLLSQYLPDQYTRVRAGELASDPHALVLDRVRDVLRGYAAACCAGSTT